MSSERENLTDRMASATLAQLCQMLREECDKTKPREYVVARLQARIASRMRKALLTYGMKRKPTTKENGEAYVVSIYEQALKAVRNELP